MIRYSHDKEKKIGRPCHTWNTSLKGDFNKYNISEMEWNDLSKDKKKLKQKAEQLYESDHDTSGGTTMDEWTDEETAI